MRFLTLVAGLVLSTVVLADNGLVKRESAHDAATTADRLVNVLESKGLTIFARINHAAGAAKAGLDLAPTELVLFGNPKLGTPLMNCSRTTAIDLPQKALIWTDKDGKTWLAYNDPMYLQERHGIEGCDPVLKKISGALGKLTGAAISP